MQVVVEKAAELSLPKIWRKQNRRVNDILGMQLVTPQTGPEGKKVNKVLIAQDVYYPGAFRAERNIT